VPSLQLDHDAHWPLIAVSSQNGCVASKHRVEDYVKRRVDRSYLESNGWWAQLVLDEFSFLDDLGFSLTGSPLAGVHFHQKGHYIRFTGPRRDVTVDYDPESKWIGADIVESYPTMYIPLDGLIAQYLPNAEPPPRRPFDREMVGANVRWWAAGLRQIASNVL
jgi:hypothetical protein